MGGVLQQICSAFKLFEFGSPMRSGAFVLPCTSYASHPIPNKLLCCSHQQSLLSSCQACLGQQAGSVPKHVPVITHTRKPATPGSVHIGALSQSVWTSRPLQAAPVAPWQAVQ